KLSICSRRKPHKFPAGISSGNLGLRGRLLRSFTDTRVVFLQILGHHPLFGFRIHITPEDVRTEHRVARQELADRVLLRRVDFHSSRGADVELGFRDVPRSGYELENFSSREAVWPTPHTWQAPQRHRRQHIVLWLAHRRWQWKERVVRGWQLNRVVCWKRHREQLVALGDAA